MEKNTILAFVLSMIVILLWYKMMPTRRMPDPPEQRAEQPLDVYAPDDQRTKPLITGVKTKIKSQTKEKTITVETPLMRISFNTRGAGVTAWEIRDMGGWVNLVLPQEGESMVLGTFPELIFDSKDQHITLHKSDPVREIRFSARNDDGLRIDKIYRIDGNSFMTEIDLQITNTTRTPLSLDDWELGWGPGLGTTKPEQKDNKRQMRVIGYNREELVKLGSEKYFDDFVWIGVDNRYFVAALIPEANQGYTFVKAQTGKKTPPQFAWHASAQLAPNETKTFSFKLYVGPKGYIHLQELGYHLEESVNFGFFGFLGKLALRSLYFFKRLTGNYGWAIMMLSACLQVFFFPLTLKSFKASMAMKKLQPQIKHIQAKYKGDSKRLNVELMNLYKSTGTNPFGGCLPMLFQLPVFWALFTTLRNTFELRGAPFIFWIKDLSVYDPLYIMPVLMGIGMLVQQKMMSVSADPQQARMMMFMPIIFTFFFLKFPAGLVLYWFTNSLLTMAGQLIIMQRDKRKGTA